MCCFQLNASKSREAVTLSAEELMAQSHSARRNAADSMQKHKECGAYGRASEVAFKLCVPAKRIPFPPGFLNLQDIV